MPPFWRHFEDLILSRRIGPEARTALIALISPIAGDPPEQTPTPAEKRHLGRYEELGTIGKGNMGVVHRVLDPALLRTMALKVVHNDLHTDDGLARFIEEAQATAQLQHPGIVPVYELGRLDDGRLYYTMREVVGRTLREAVNDLYRPEDSLRTWTMRRLVDVFHQACQAVGYAHRRGVLHRDIKPTNIMLGDFGEVYVVDWGLAKVIGRQERPVSPQQRVDSLRTVRRGDSDSATRTGDVLGTPAYMSPEQARGDIEEMGPASDVYALGAVLFEILTGKRAVTGRDGWQVIANAIMGVITPLEGPFPIPPELADVVRKAMSRESAERYTDAVAMAAAVGAWLEGESQRERALQSVAEADLLLAERKTLLDRADALRAEAGGILATLAPWDPISRKRVGWALQEEAATLDRQAATREADATQHLQGALTHRPDLDEALDRLADLHRARLLDAEARRDQAAAARSEALLRATGRPAHLRWLNGEGSLNLDTRPAGHARLYRYETVDHRLSPVFVADLGLTPIVERPLAPGSYLVQVNADGHQELRYPVQIGRLERWDGLRPGSDQASPIALPPVNAFGPGALYVPAGPTWVGGDPDARRPLQRTRAWVDGFAIDRNPVSNQGWLAFINALVAEGRTEEAVRLTPRVAGVYDWTPALPVRGIDHAAALAYAAWRATRTGLPWRLPTELEWEKAARGVDGRYFPWGDHLDPTWCSMADSHESGGRLAPVGEPPADDSPYGVLGLGGNVADWCADAPSSTLDEDRRPVRGGRWNQGAWASRAASRFWVSTRHRDEAIGLRLVCGWG